MTMKNQIGVGTTMTKEIRKYQCAACGKEFVSPWTEEEALAEAKQLWGDVPKEQMVVICDDCFAKGITKIH